MTDFDKLILFVVIVGLSILAGKASAKLARETGVPALVIGTVGGVAGHAISTRI